MEAMSTMSSFLKENNVRVIIQWERAQGFHQNYTAISAIKHWKNFRSNMIIDVQNRNFMIHLHVFSRIFQSPLYIQILTFPNLCAILCKCHFHSLLINCRRQLYFYSRLVWLIGKLHFGSKYDLRHKSSLLPWYTYFPYIFFLSSRVVQYCNILRIALYHTITYLVNLILKIDFLFLR